MRPPGEQGFTLIELLVSLALLAVTATLLLAALTTARGIEQRAEAAATASESISAAQNVLRDRIEAMVPDTFFSGSTPITDVRGDDRIFSFSATPDASRRPAPQRRYRLALTRAGELSLFDVDAQASRPNPMAPSVAGWNRAPLLGNVASLRISYFGAAPPDNQRRWRDIWQDRPGLPELVRVRVGFAPGDRRLWPDLLVRPAANVTSYCIVDSVTGRCRTGAR
jgi:general secretion pathway protein J